MFRKVKRYLSDPYYSLGYDLITRHSNWMSERFYVKVLWRIEMGYNLDLDHPKTFNEKLQWMKVYDHNPLYTTLVDKYRVKQWVADRIGAEFVIPTLAVYQSVDEIDLDKLPNQFVLKCNHDSGSVVVCKDKGSFDLDAAKKKLGEAVQRNYYWSAREWAYKNVRPLIFAETYMEEQDSSKKMDDLLNYKFLCSNGEVNVMYITVKNGDIFEDYFDAEGKPLNIQRDYRHSGMQLAIPSTFEQMKAIASKLSQSIRQVRVDLYEINGKVYFSEFTFYDWGGYAKFKPKEWDLKLGEKIQLNQR